LSEQQKPWHLNDQLFFDELEAGRRAERHVAHMCLDAGLWVHMPPKSVRLDIAEAGEYADEADLWVGRREPAKIEVKSRKVSFTSVENISDEYLPFFITTVSSWIVAETKPVAFVIVSAQTGTCVVVSRKSFPRWKRRRCVDRVRQIEDTFFCAQKRDIHPFDRFVRAMHKRERSGE
jgi:hypothetical protein